MTPVGAAAVAAPVAALCELILFSPLGFLRSRAIAGRIAKNKPLARAAQRGWHRGLPIQVVSLLFRRALAFSGVFFLSAFSIPHGVSGLVLGAAEGVLFGPTRRIAFLQQVRRPQSALREARAIVQQEGFWGLWRGSWTNGLRSGVGGAAYFGSLSSAAAFFPSMPVIIPGAVAAAASTIAVHPLELMLARVYQGRPWSSGPFLSTRGLGLCLLRAIPGATFYYWLFNKILQGLVS